MMLTIAPGSVASWVPITPDDSIVVTVKDLRYSCFVTYSAGSVGFRNLKGYFAGTARLVPGSVLPKAFDGKLKFKAVAVSSGNGFEVPLAAIKPVKPRCAACGKSMPKIGSARANGANHTDWASRKYHKSCWNAVK